jgi:uncharacterized protein YgiM (DUF1202 family)
MRRRFVVTVVVALGLLAGTAASAENAWVRGAPLNLRSGPGTKYRILAATQPGDRLQVLKRGDGWTQVRTREGKEGWIAGGYLDPKAPPMVRLAELEAEAEKLRATLSSTTDEAARLRESNETLTGSDSGQREEIERLTKENYKLRAGTRSAEWLTGALILSMGMVLGAIGHSVSGRRRSQRLRL